MNHELDTRQPFIHFNSILSMKKQPFSSAKRDTVREHDEP